uniref:Uncharacterized protein n=1 Tax=Ditylum brightwellii TaxID=49249 RepID=A0A7S4VTR1_9STRA
MFDCVRSTITYDDNISTLFRPQILKNKPTSIIPSFLIHCVHCHLHSPLLFHRNDLTGKGKGEGSATLDPRSRQCRKDNNTKKIQRRTNRSNRTNTRLQH